MPYKKTWEQKHRTPESGIFLTVDGRVVYNRPKHFFLHTDLPRIFSKLGYPADNADWAAVDTIWPKIVRWRGRSIKQKWENIGDLYKIIAKDVNMVITVLREESGGSPYLQAIDFIFKVINELLGELNIKIEIIKEET